MPDLHSTVEQLRLWLRAPNEDLSHRERTLRWWVNLAFDGISKLRRDRASQMAAALTYHTLFSLMPTVVLMLVVMSVFVNDKDRESFKAALVNWVLAPIQQVESVEPEAGTIEPDGTDGTDTVLLDPVGATRKQEFDDLRLTLNIRIESIIDHLEGVSFRGIGVAGVLIFIWGSTGLLAMIEGSFNTVYNSAQGRPPHVRLPIYYTVITLAPMVIIGGQILSRSVTSLVSERWTDWFVEAAAWVSTPLAVWIVLVLLYVLLTNTGVSIRCAAAGGFVAAVVWLVGNHLFAVYVQRAAISTLYGALGLLPLFLVSMWITWLIILFGLELSYALQMLKEGRYRRSFDLSWDPPVVDRALLLPLASKIADAFRRGETIDLSTMSRSLFLSERAIEKMLSLLLEAGIVHKVRGRGRQGFSLAMPPEEILISHVLEAGSSPPPEPGTVEFDLSWSLVAQMKGCIAQVTEETTLADLSLS